jgi:hypothetical protein
MVENSRKNFSPIIEGLIEGGSIRAFKKGKKIRVHVTQNVIDRALPCDQKSCLLAEGVKDTLDSIVGRRHTYTSFRISAVSANVKFTLNGYRYHAALPDSAAKELYLFDLEQTKCKARGFDVREATAAARSIIKPFHFVMTIFDKRKIPKKLTPAQLAARRAARHERNAYKAARGETYVKAPAAVGRQIAVGPLLQRSA